MSGVSDPRLFGARAAPSPPDSRTGGQRSLRYGNARFRRRAPSASGRSAYSLGIEMGKTLAASVGAPAGSIMLRPVSEQATPSARKCPLCGLPPLRHCCAAFISVPASSPLTRNDGGRRDPIGGRPLRGHGSSCIARCGSRQMPDEEMASLRTRAVQYRPNSGNSPPTVRRPGLRRGILGLEARSEGKATNAVRTELPRLFRCCRRTGTGALLVANRFLLR